ncbi:MAG: hypothetical protein GY705_18960, partial [Bacteroidetes bacterium]|nr:hypothetical protein [Bacteroidota bacterium]
MEGFKASNYKKVQQLKYAGHPLEMVFGSAENNTDPQPPKHHKNYLKSLKSFCITIHTFYPDIETKNPYRRLAQQIELPPHLSIETYLELFDELVHALTSINHLYRIKTKEGYESIREDNMMALQLLSPEIFPDKFISKAHKSTYNALHKIYGT